MGFGREWWELQKMLEEDHWQISIIEGVTHHCSGNEATINNRPLTYMCDDVEGVSQPLTPPHLVYGRQIIKASV